jgi:ABC-type multidrug transport system permease subunit
MADREQKRFVARQAIGGLLVSMSAVAFLAILFANLPLGFWSAVGLVSTLAVGAAIALSVLQRVRSDDHQMR